MPAIESFSTGPELRAGALNGTQVADSAQIPAGASDAFVAALLAQGMLPYANPEAPQVAQEAAGAGLLGQELPGVRPALAATPGVRRAPVTLAPATAPAEALPGAGTAAIAEDGDNDFAMAFAALQDAMVGAGGHGPAASADGEGDGPTLAAGGLADALSALGGGAHAARGEASTAGVDGVVATQVGRHAEVSQAGNGNAHVYAARPAPLPMDQPAVFAERLTQHVSVMLGDAVQSATIAVTPPDLGPVEVRVTVSGDEARIQLAATHQATREALHDALPKLRAALADSGLSLGQAGVFAQMPERQHQADAQGPASRGRDDGETELAPLAAASAPRTLKLGLVDAFV